MTSQKPVRVPDLRQRRRVETSAVISDSAIELFEASGVDGVTVEQIAEAAGISPRTYFRYFRTKEEAALTSYFAFAGRITSWLEKDAGSDLLGSLEVAIQQSMEEIDADPPARERLLRMRRLLAKEPALQAAAVQSDASAVGEFARLLVRKPHSSLTESEALLISSVTVTVASLAMREWAERLNSPSSGVSLGQTYSRMREMARRHLARDR